MRCTGLPHSGSVVHSTLPLTRPRSLTFVQVTLLPSGGSELPRSELRGWWLVPTAGGEEPGGQVEVYGLEHSVLPAQGLLAAAESCWVMSWATTPTLAMTPQSSPTPCPHGRPPDGPGTGWSTLLGGDARPACPVPS